MKKTILICLFAIAVTAAVFAQTGTIRELSGDVELKPAGASVFTAARAGSQVAQDTIVSTGFKSTAIITVGSAEITVRPLTRLTLSEIQSSEGTEALNVNLQAGRVRVEVRPPAGTRATTTVQSPSATASVRGTVFEMDTKNLNVLEGRVAYQGNNGLSFPVTGGNSSTVDSAGGAQDPVLIAESELLPPSPVGAGSSGDEVNIPDAMIGVSFDVVISFE